MTSYSLFPKPGSEGTPDNPRIEREGTRKPKTKREKPEPKEKREPMKRISDIKKTRQKYQKESYKRFRRISVGSLRLLKNLMPQNYSRSIAYKRENTPYVGDKALTLYSMNQIDNTDHNRMISEFEKRRELQKYLEIQRQKKLSPSTIAILQRLARVQNAGSIAKARMQRIKNEQKLIESATNILKTPSIFGSDSATFSLFDNTYNPLFAPNVFAERPDNKIMITNRPNILMTRETHNNLSFFGEGRQNDKAEN